MTMPHEHPGVWQEGLSSGSCRAGQPGGELGLPGVRKEREQRQRREGGNKNLVEFLILPQVEFMAELPSAAQGWGHWGGDSFDGLAKEPPGRTNPAKFLGLSGGAAIAM